MLKKSSDFFCTIGYMVMIICMSWFIVPKNAEATAQWSRKYKTPCSDCHTVFPRLTFEGERFMRNGYQDPDNAVPDGDETAKTKINEDLVLDAVRNILGFRLNLTPIKVEKKGINIAGDDKDKITIGDANWIQFFVAGSIFKNVSFFTEMEFEDDEFSFSWWHLGVHNIFDSKAVNFMAGNISPLEYSSHSNRLRILVPITNAVYDIKTANNTGDDSISISEARPGLQYYGYTGPLVWWAGITPGKHASDVNTRIFGWGGVRLEVSEAMESQLEGSSISFWAFQGEDGKNNTSTSVFRTSTSERYQAAGNLRYKALDVQTSYVWGRDTDWNLSTAAEEKAEFYGVALQAAYLAKKWYPSVSYDYVNKDTGTGSSTHKITPAISYMIRENVRLGAYLTFDINNERDHTKKNTYQINLRTMF